MSQIKEIKRHVFGDEIAITIEIDGVLYSGCLTEVEENE